MNTSAFVVCLIVSFVFSGIEGGLFSVDRVRVEHRLRQGDPAARILTRLLGQPSRVLATVLLVTNLCNILALGLVLAVLTPRFGHAASAAALLGYVPVFVLGLEMLPKAIFRRFPYRATAFFCRPLEATVWVLTPLLFVLERVSTWFPAVRPGRNRRLLIGREDFKYLTIESERSGVISGDERKMIHGVVNFRKVKLADITVPLSEFPTVSASEPVSDWLNRARSVQNDRWLVVDDEGTVKGHVSRLDVLMEPRHDVTIDRFQRRFVPLKSSDSAQRALRQLRAARVPLALVLNSDAAKSPVGIVTWVDLVRRLVAVADEADANPHPGPRADALS